MSRWIVYLSTLCVLSGCATPAQRFDQQAQTFGFSDQLIDTPLFTHKIYRNTLALKHIGKTLHVYLDGDGSPWEQGQWLAEDPTARNPLILKLMQRDNHPAMLLGRPCYHGLSHLIQCSAKYWTSHRYAQTVVDSLVLALQHYLATAAVTEVALIGYSGGGTLAMLMAPQLTEVRTIITLAANIDTEAWSRWHAAPPLYASLNPAQLPPLPHPLKQWHFAGADDRNVPPEIIRAVAVRQHAHFQILPGLDHHGCWECVWPDLLGLLSE